MKKLLFFFLLAILITSCSDYRKVLRGDDYNLKFDLANRLYDNKKFERSVVLFEQVFQHSPKSAEGEIAYFRLAKSYFEFDDFNMAEYYFGNYLQRFPYSKKNEDVLFLNAFCKVKNSPEYHLDQGETKVAINAVQQFIDQYPQSLLIDSCNNIIDKLNFKLELKDFDIVKLYSKTQNYKAAVTSASIFMEKYMSSKFKEEVNYLYVKNLISLTKNSIDSKKEERIDQTKESFLNFVENYGNSIYFKELKSMLNSITLLEKEQ